MMPIDFRDLKKKLIGLTHALLIFRKQQFGKNISLGYFCGKQSGGERVNKTARGKDEKKSVKFLACFVNF